MYGLTSIKVWHYMELLWWTYLLIDTVQGVGRRYANLVCKKAEVDMNKRAGELTEDEVCHVMLSV